MSGRLPAPHASSAVILRAVAFLSAGVTAPAIPSCCVGCLSDRGSIVLHPGRPNAGNIRTSLMDGVLQQILLAAPLFLLVFVGYAIMKWAGWTRNGSEALAKFVFTVALPAMLFRLMSGFAELPAGRRALAGSPFSADASSSS
jgi:hypothetical protein